MQALCFSVILAVSSFARTTWMPDPSGGQGPELDVAKVEYGAVKVWSPDGRHQYFHKTHFPVANVLLTNRSETDGLTTMKAFVTYLDAPGGAKDLGERGSSTRTVPPRASFHSSTSSSPSSTPRSARTRPRRAATRSGSVRRRTTSASRRT